MRAKETALVVLCMLLLAGLINASAAGSNLIELTDDNFNAMVLQREGPILVEFYSPYCGHCTAFAPELEKIANDLQSVMPVGQVDVTKHRKMTPNYDIRGVPAVFLFGRDKEHPLLYKGRNDQRSVVQFVLTNLNHSYVTLTSPSVALPRFLAEKNEAAALPRIVYFAGPTDVDNHEAPVQFVSLALTWKDSALFGFVRGADFVPSWKTTYRIEALPALVVFSPVDLSETVITETWPAGAGAGTATFTYIYTGSLTDEKQLNEFCMEAGARSSLYYDTHRGYGLSFNRTSFNLLFMVVVVGAVFGFVYWSRRLNNNHHHGGKSVLPTTYPPSAPRNFAD